MLAAQPKPRQEHHPQTQTPHALTLRPPALILLQLRHVNQHKPAEPTRIDHRQARPPQLRPIPAQQSTPVLQSRCSWNSTSGNTAKPK